MLQQQLESTIVCDDDFHGTAYPHYVHGVGTACPNYVHVHRSASPDTESMLVRLQMVTGLW